MPSELSTALVAVLTGWVVAFDHGPDAEVPCWRTYPVAAPPVEDGAVHDTVRVPVAVAVTDIAVGVPAGTAEVYEFSGEFPHEVLARASK